jgi:hypothetical protein
LLEYSNILKSLCSLVNIPEDPEEDVNVAIEMRINADDQSENNQALTRRSSRIKVTPVSYRDGIYDKPKLKVSRSDSQIAPATTTPLQVEKISL